MGQYIYGWLGGKNLIFSLALVLRNASSVSLGMGLKQLVLAQISMLKIFR